MDQKTILIIVVGAILIGCGLGTLIANTSNSSANEENELGFDEGYYVGYGMGYEDGLFDRTYYPLHERKLGESFIAGLNAGYSDGYSDGRHGANLHPDPTHWDKRQ